MSDDNKNNLTDSAKRRLRRKAREASQSKRKNKHSYGHGEWYNDAIVAVVTEADKKQHAIAVHRACLRLQEDGVVSKSRRLITTTTSNGNMMTYVG